MKIGPVDLEKEILLVAEIGNCHEGSVGLAEDLIGLAAEAGAGAVKFQTIVPERLVSCEDSERIKQLRRFCLKHEEFEHLVGVAAKKSVLFLSTPFDLESVRFLEPLVPAFKIASGDNNFYPLIEAIAGTHKPVILSAGLTTLEEIKETVDFIRGVWARDGVRQEIAVLHCVVNYPTDSRDVNLKAIESLKSLGVTVGYSDHTLGTDAAALAVGLGARIIEKHFTLDKNYSDFRDHKIAADPKEMSELAAKVRKAQVLLGDGVKRVMDCERENKAKVRRSIAAGRDLKKGTTIQQQDLTWIRPGHGLPPGKEGHVLGKVLTRDLRQGELIFEKDLK